MMVLLTYLVCVGIHTRAVGGFGGGALEELFCLIPLHHPLAPREALYDCFKMGLRMA